MLLSINSTEDALEFGRICDPAILPKMNELRQILLNLSRQAQLETTLNLAMKYARKAQFLREAIEAFNARNKEETPKKN